MFAVSESGGSAEIKAAVIGGIVGSMLGGGFSALATWQAYKHNLALERIKTQETINGILQALHLEMEAVLKSFEWFGEQLNDVKEGEVFAYSFQIRCNYFVVYPNNTAIIGQIEDANLVRQIIASYTSASSFLDAIEVNDTDEKRLREYQNLRAVNPTVFKTQYDDHIERMTNFAPLLRRSYQELKQEAEKLSKAVDDYRQKHSVTKSN